MTDVNETEGNSDKKSRKKTCPVCNGTGDVSEFGIKIAERRAKLGLGRYQLAKLSGISNVTIGNVERGDVSPRITTIRSLEFALNVFEGATVAAAEEGSIHAISGSNESVEGATDEQRSDDNSSVTQEEEPTRRVFYQAEADDDWAKEIQEEDGE